MSSPPKMHEAKFLPDRGTSGAVAPIGPANAKARTSSSLLPDHEFIPINTDAMSLDRMQMFSGDSPFASSLFSSPLFGPVTGYGDPSAATGGSLLADLHADSKPMEK